MSLWAAETVIATETAVVGMAEAEVEVEAATIRENAATRATVTTIRDNDEDTRPLFRLERLLQGFVKGLSSFFRLTLSRQRG